MFIGLQRTARLLRIDFLIKGDAEAVVLHPGHAARDAADIAQFHIDAVAALHLEVALGHHPAVGKIAHPHAVDFSPLLNANVSQQEQAVACHAPCLNARHLRIASMSCPMPPVARARIIQRAEGHRQALGKGS